MKKRVKIVRTYEIEFEHKEHYERLLRRLNEEHIHGLTGAGAASDSQVYTYSCRCIGKGTPLDKTQLTT